MKHVFWIVFVVMLMTTSVFGFEELTQTGMNQSCCFLLDDTNYTVFVEWEDVKGKEGAVAMTGKGACELITAWANHVSLDSPQSVHATFRPLVKNSNSWQYSGQVVNTQIKLTNYNEIEIERKR